MAGSSNRQDYDHWTDVEKLLKPGRMTHVCNLKAWEAKTEGSQVQGWLGLHRETVLKDRKEREREEEGRKGKGKEERKRIKCEGRGKGREGRKKEGRKVE